MNEKIKARVALGAALLDEKQPGWADRIDLDRLSISSCYRCIVGQLFGDFDREQMEALGLSTANGWIDAAHHGFDFFNDASEYEPLNAAWRTEIAKRRTAPCPK